MNRTGRAHKTAPRRERGWVETTYDIEPERRPTFAAALEERLFHSWSCWLRYSLCCRARERRTRARAEKRWRWTRKPYRAAEPCRAGHCWRRCSRERFLAHARVRVPRRADVVDSNAAPRGERIPTFLSALHSLFGRAASITNSALFNYVCSASVRSLCLRRR